LILSNLREDPKREARGGRGKSGREHKNYSFGLVSPGKKLVEKGFQKSQARGRSGGGNWAKTDI